MQAESFCRKGEPDWNDTPMHQVMLRYMKIMKRHRRILEQRMKGTGVYRGQHQILMILSEHSNTSQKELAQRLFVSTATIAVSVKKLEKGGYITRLVDQEDNRANRLCLTEKGRDMVIYSQQYFRNVEVQMFDGFEEKELSAMAGYLDRIYENLSKIPTEEDKNKKEE